jgi:metal-responsive CopG/Arc/MetJ family transcriptional regulator
MSEWGDYTMRAISVNLPSKMKAQLDRWSRRENQKKSEIVRDALRQYFTRKEFDELRAKMIPRAQKMGIYTDEDVFKLVS